MSLVLWCETNNVRELALLMLEEQYRPRANVQNHFLYIISLDWVFIFFLL